MTFPGIPPQAVWWIMAVWFAALGGAVGSFLNVVVYRLPTAKSLIHPPSHCPACKHPIRWYDNVPVVSWFVLRGRCRDCGARISPRYPLVESLTAAVFVLLGLVEFQSGGTNLPVRVQGGAATELTLLQLAGITLYHLVLLCTLLAAALIELDGHAIPRRLVLPVLILGLLAGAVWPDLHPAPAIPSVGGWIGGLTDGLLGLAAGLMLGLILWRALGQTHKTGNLWGPALAGLFLGYQAAVALTLAAAVLHVPVAFIQRRRLDPAKRSAPRKADSPTPRFSLTVWLTPLSLAWILYWNTLIERLPMPP